MTDACPEQLRKNWRHNWLWALLQLSDIGLQNERWLNEKITNPAWTYVEFMCTYFDDLALKEYGGYEGLIRDGKVTREEFECIKNFHALLDDYQPPRGDVYNPHAILSGKDWQEIVATGSASMKLLEALITEPSEKEIFVKRLYAPPLSEGDFTWPDIPSKKTD